MIRKPVTSSDLRAVGFDTSTHSNEIEFQDDSTHQYDGVPPAIHGALMQASPHGSYFHREIKDRYRYRRIR